MDVVTRVRAAIERINTDGSLAARRARSSRSTTAAISSRSPCSTVLHNMLFGIALIFLIQWMFLGNLRCALIVSATIPVALVPRRHHHGAARGIRQSAVGRRDRSRHHRRRHRHHGGEHLPPSRASRAGARPPIARRATDRQAAPHPRRRGRGRQADLLLGDHHHRGVPAAVHHAGRRRPDLRPDVAHLCLCAARRGHRHLHRDAGDVLDPAARAGRARSRPSSCATSARSISDRAAAGRAALSRSRPRSALAFLAGLRRPRRAARHRIPAQAGGRQSLDPRAAAAHHHARSRAWIPSRASAT